MPLNKSSSQIALTTVASNKYTANIVGQVEAKLVLKRHILSLSSSVTAVHVSIAIRGAHDFWTRSRRNSIRPFAQPSIDGNEPLTQTTAVIQLQFNTVDKAVRSVTVMRKRWQSSCVVTLRGTAHIRLYPLISHTHHYHSSMGCRSRNITV